MARFHARSIDGLISLRDRLNAGTWSPGPTSRKVAQQPKAREIHAPAYRDRVVHHWLVPLLEAIYEPRFCFDSYANRKGKGLLKAVQRLQGFSRQVQSGEGGGWYLQLDIHNFFYSIDRRLLWQMLKPVLQWAKASAAVLRTTHAALNRHPLAAGVHCHATEAELAMVPQHKRLENAAPGRGLPIGNLLSQFLANVYLDPLDQFIKHELKARRYLRYVDDFVLVHHSREQLLEWQGRIEAFLRDRLHLSLKAERKLLPLTHGVDFLGYIVHPTHLRVRRRVVSHARAALATWAKAHVQGGYIHATPAEIRRGASQVASYFGHLRHARANALEADFRRRNPWIASLEVKRHFSYQLQGRRLRIPILGRKTA